MWKFTQELATELQNDPYIDEWGRPNLEGFCFHVKKLHQELVLMEEGHARAILTHFESLRELLDFYSAGEGLRPVLPAEPVQAVQTPAVQDAVTLRTAYIWRHPEDEENLAQLPDGKSALNGCALVFSLEDTQERGALESLLIKRVAARRVPAFCFSVDYEKPDARFSQGFERIRNAGEVWRCLPNTLEFSTARTPANYRLMGSAPAQRACQVFHAQFVAPMDNIQMFEL
jgi:hypothetical protein